MPLRPAPGVRWATVSGGMVIYIAEASLFVDLDDSGALVWSLLESHGWAPQAVADELIEVAHLTPTNARSLVDDFVDECVRRGAVVR